MSLLAAIVARLRTEHRVDPVAGRRHAFWSGRLGAWLFRLADIRPAPAAASPSPATPLLHPTPTPTGHD